MSLDNYGNFSDVVVHGHKDRPAMSGAIDDLNSGSHANIFRVSTQSDAQPLNATGSNDYIDFAVLDSPYGSNSRSRGQDGHHGRHGHHGHHGFDGHPVTDGHSGHGHHGHDGHHSSHGHDGHHRSAAGAAAVSGEGAPDVTPAEATSGNAEDYCADDCSVPAPVGDTAGGDTSGSNASPYSYSAQDKMDEVLLDLESAMRATGRGSTAIATEWMREAQADMMELAQALGLGSGAGSDGGDCSEGGGCSEGGSSSEVSSEAPVEQVAADDNSHAGGHDSGAQSPSVEAPAAAEGDGHTVESDSVNDSVEPGTANPDRSKPVTATIDQLLSQNDRNQNPVKPGENTSQFYWSGGRSGAGVDAPSTPDPKYNYVLAWNMIYPEQGKTADPNANVEMQNFRTYVHTKDGQWLEVQNQNKAGIGGGLSDADFADYYAVYDSPITNGSDGVASFKAPPPGYNFQPWINGRGGFDNQNIDGIYVSGLVRADRPNANLVMDQGADWYAHEAVRLSAPKTPME
ncbi:MAG: hypothetical protein IPP57_00390 [Candidatus Obscuribacter sp.]|nr:hypothetical protein [Candidatus Obscuribacter sp.]